MSKFNPKIIFFGTPDFALPALDALKNAGITPVVVVASTDAPKGRGMNTTPPPTKVWAQKNEVPVLQPEKIRDNKDFFDKLRGYSPDLFVVASYGKILPQTLLDIPKHGTLNIHPSLLPKYRGPSPIHGAMLAGDKKTGVTIMLVDEEMDHGPILKISDLKVQISDLTFTELEKKLAELGAELLIKTIPKWIAGEIKPEEQRHDSATYTKKIKKEDGHIDWDVPAEEADRKIRALNPWPGAFAFQNNKRLIIRSANILDSNQDKNPGEVFIYNEDIAIACKSGALLINRLQQEGKKEADSRDFLRGNKDIIGNILS